MTIKVNKEKFNKNYEKYKLKGLSDSQIQQKLYEKKIVGKRNYYYYKKEYYTGTAGYKFEPKRINESEKKILKDKKLNYFQKNQKITEYKNKLNKKNIGYKDKKDYTGLWIPKKPRKKPYYKISKDYPDDKAINNQKKIKKDKIEIEIQIEIDAVQYVYKNGIKYPNYYLKPYKEFLFLNKKHFKSELNKIYNHKIKFVNNEIITKILYYPNCHIIIYSVETGEILKKHVIISDNPFK